MFRSRISVGHDGLASVSVSVYREIMRSHRPEKIWSKVPTRKRTVPFKCFFACSKTVSQSAKLPSASN